MLPYAALVQRSLNGRSWPEPSLPANARFACTPDHDADDQFDDDDHTLDSIVDPRTDKCNTGTGIRHQNELRSSPVTETFEIRVQVRVVLITESVQ
jgi:hypothetical protein